jgi:IS30 family transposase
MNSTTEWEEIRRLHFVDGVPKKEIARRLGRDVKTVRRALIRDEPPHERRTATRPAPRPEWWRRTAA